MKKPDCLMGDPGSRATGHSFKVGNGTRRSWFRYGIFLRDPLRGRWKFEKVVPCAVEVFG